jgi:hypothetical protein
MKKENRFALFCFVVIAFLLAGFMVETYWNCRLIKLASRENVCLDQAQRRGLA